MRRRLVSRNRTSNNRDVSRHYIGHALLEQRLRLTVDDAGLRAVLHRRVDADGRVRRGVGGDAVELTPVEVMKLRKGDPELKAADPVDAHVVARSLAAAAAEGAEGVYARLLQQQ